MTFWLDEQLPPVLAPWLGSRFKVVAKSLGEVGLKQASDKTIFEAAGRFSDVVIVSKDQDFADLVRQLGKPPQIVWLRFGNCSLVRIQMLLSNFFPKTIELLQAGDALVEITETGW